MGSIFIVVLLLAGAMAPEWIAWMFNALAVGVGIWCTYLVVKRSPELAQSISDRAQEAIGKK